MIFFITSLPSGSVDLRYKLGLITHKYQLTSRNLADGFPHYVNITRHNRTIKTQVLTLTAAALIAMIESSGSPIRGHCPACVRCFSSPTQHKQVFKMHEQVSISEDAGLENTNVRFMLLSVRTHLYTYQSMPSLSKPQHNFGKYYKKSLAHTYLKRAAEDFSFQI